MSELQINVKGPSELKLQITIAADKSVQDLKQAIAAKSDVPADRQRLIYSGRVLKDEDALSVYKIQSSHTIHMVKGAARGPAAAAAPAPPQALPTMQTGQNPHDPLTQLNGHMGYGLMAGLNPFADMGVNPNDPNMMQNMMNSPEFLNQMSSMLSNPAVLEQAIAANPQLSPLGPQMREMFQDDRFRQMLSNPETLRAMLQMSAAMRNAGIAPPGMPGFPGSPPGGGFPAPGLPSSAATSTSPSSPSSPPSGTANTNMFNPFMFPPTGAGVGGAEAGAAGGNGAFNPALMQQMLSGLGGMGGMGAAPAAPADARPPEVRFEVQLQQLQDMGFTNAAQNVRALLATAGNVNGAIEYILNGGGV